MKLVYSYLLGDYSLCSLNSFLELSSYNNVSNKFIASSSVSLVKFSSNFSVVCDSLFSSKFVTVILNLQNSCLPFEFSMLLGSFVPCSISWLSISFVVVGVVSILFFDWDVIISLGSNCFLYSSVLVFDIMFIKLLFGKIVSPIGLIFNIYDSDILLKFS